MEDFIIAQPLNGFPFIPRKAEDHPAVYNKWTLSHEETMRLYWFSYFSNLNVYISVSTTPIIDEGEDVTTIIDFKSPIPAYAYGISNSIPETHERCTADNEDYMVYFNTEKFDPFYFRINSPFYIDEDSYEIQFIGMGSFSEFPLNIRLYIGADENSTEYNADKVHFFSIPILDKEIPCVLTFLYIDTYHVITDFSVDVSIDSGFLDE